MDRELSVASRQRVARRSLALLVGCASLLVLVASCSGTSSESDAAATPGASLPRNGGTLVVGISSEPDTFNPYLTNSRSVLDIANRVLPRLWREVPPDGSGAPGLEPELAAPGWALSEDGTRLELPLEEGWSWEDGTRVTCEDLRFTLGIQKHPRLGRRVAEYKEHIRRIECPEPLLAVYHFDAPSARPLEDVNDIHVLPRSLSDLDPADWAETDWAERLLAAGPFRIADHRAGQEIVLERNDAYVDAPRRPRLDRIVLRPVSDSTTAATQLLAGELDVVGSLPPDSARMVEASPDVRVEGRAAWRYVYVGWNTIDPDAYAAYREEREAACRRAGDERCPDEGEALAELARRRPHPILGDSRVRRALTLAIDRRLILDTLLLGEGEIPPSPILAPLPEHDPTLQPWDYDPERAHELLLEAGFGDADNDGILDRDGRAFSISLWVGAGNKLREDAALLIKQNLAMLGVQLEIVPVDAKAFYGRLMTRRMDGWIARWHIPARVDMRPYLHAQGASTGGGNFGVWSHPRADELASAAAIERDPATRADLWHEWEAIFREEQPYTLLFRDRELVGVRERVRGTASLLANDLLHGVEDWWIEER